MCICMYVYVSMYMYMYMYMSMSMYMNVYMYMYVFICVYIYVYVYMYIYLYMYMYMYMDVYMYTPSFPIYAYICGTHPMGLPISSCFLVSGDFSVFFPCIVSEKQERDSRYLTTAATMKRTAHSNLAVFRTFGFQGPCTTECFCKFGYQTNSCAIGGRHKGLQLLQRHPYVYAYGHADIIVYTHAYLILGVYVHGYVYLCMSLSTYVYIHMCGDMFTVIYVYTYKIYTSSIEYIALLGMALGFYRRS